MIEIRPHIIKKCSVSVPGSKSYSHRILVGAALCDGKCIINGILKSQDVDMTRIALRKMGVNIYDREEEQIVVDGLSGYFKDYNSSIYLGNSGTSMRLLTVLASLGQGSYIILGNKRMNMRPMGDLLKAMNELGIPVYSLRNNDCSPLMVVSSKPRINSIEINCSITSQYLSGLLLVAPCFKNGLNIIVKNKMVSRPYVDMTISIMSDFGIIIKRSGYNIFNVPGSQSYKAINYDVEPDCSHACYFWAAAAITGGSVTVKKINRDSIQGDIKFLNILEKMGCVVWSDKFGITVVGGKLKGVAVNMSDMPDVVPTLAVVASFAVGITKISGISHLRVKESDRVDAIANELRRIGISVKVSDNELLIKGGKPKESIVETYMDHRIAMSFSLVGLKIEGIKIKKESCVNKSFPEFWSILNQLYNS